MKNFLIFFILISLTGCLQEAAYIENYGQNSMQKNNKYIDMNNTINNNSEPDNSEDISWNNIFDEYFESNNKKKEENKKIENKIIQKEKIKDKPKENQKKINEINNNVNKDLIKISKPLDGIIISKFKKNNNSQDNEGVSFKANNSKNIISSSDGRVIYIDNNGETGKTIIIKFNNGLVASYVFHGEILIENNQNIKKNEKIGYINLNSGKNILYFTIRENGKFIDPENLF